MSAPRCCWWATSKYRITAYASSVKVIHKFIHSLTDCNKCVLQKCVLQFVVCVRVVPKPRLHNATLDGGGKEM